MIIILNAMNIIGVALRRNIIRLRVNGRNIVHRQLPTLLDVTCCVFTPCCMLLAVVACCSAKFETGQTFRPVQADATLLGVVAPVYT